MKPNHLIALCVLLFAASGSMHAVAAEDKSDTSQTATQTKPKIYKYTVDGITSFSDVAPLKRRYVIWTESCYACTLTSTIDWQSTKLHLDEFSSTINDAAEKYRVDPALIRALIHAESGFNPKARSNKGALGLMQLMPATAKGLGVVDARIPHHNIFGGVHYLEGLLKRFKGDVALAAAAYNAGPEAVEKYAGIPPYAETQTYVKRVKILYQRYGRRS